ncbi:hypothetical protein MBANPS3_007357 [Mucor bainieri]
MYHPPHYVNSSKIARPSSIALPASSIQSTQTITTNNGNRKKQIKQPNARLSKSHSMHRLLLQQDDEMMEEPMHRRALLSRATTTPMPRPSSLIKRFSDHTAMKRCSSLMNPPLHQSLSSNTTTDQSLPPDRDGCGGGDLVYSSNNSSRREQDDFRLGQRVCVPSHQVVGTVRYFGETKFKEKGVWVGIELDLIGSGKNDGSIQGVRYFSCAPNTGLFVLATKVMALEDSQKKKTVVPRISKTTAIATTKKSQSSSTSTTSKRKSMIVTSSTTTTTTSSSTTASASSTTNNNNNGSTPKRYRSATTTTATPLNPSKSARTLPTTRASKAPLPTRSTPSGATKKMSTSTKTNKPALKKSSSMSTSSTDCHHHHHRSLQQQQQQQQQHQHQQQQQQQKRLSADVELERMQALLEKSRQEKRALSQQMDGQEAAWERLVSAKESYAVRVQEKDDEIARLKRLLDSSSQATHELAKMTGERDAALSRASMSEAMEKQHSKVIERLDLRVRTLQQQLETQQQQHEAAQRDHAAQMEQIRRQLTERDEAAAMVERECSELCQGHVKTIHAFETTIAQREQEYTAAVAHKDAHIAKLQLMVNDLMYPSTASPIVEDDDSTRHRLETQLELTTSELDKEREMIKAQTLEISHLKDEIKRLHRVSVCSSSDFYQLRAELEHEIDDKRRIMEEANAALEVQARLEDENERIKLTNEKTQRDLADVLRKLATTEKERGAADLLATCSRLEADNERLALEKKQTEHECMRLMDELLAIEKVEEAASASSSHHHHQQQQQHDSKMYQREIEQLRLQVNREVRKYQDLEQSKEAKIHKLYKELSDLESLVENKVFNETELEEAIECEKRKVRLLEGRLREEEEKNRRLPVHAPLSPTSPQYSLFNRHHNQQQQQQQQQKRSSTGSFSLMTSTSMDTVSDHGNLLESVYCEICEEYGHDVMTCNAYRQKTILDDDDDDHYDSRSSYYCVNCDVFDTHPTEECPNQDETF